MKYNNLSIMFATSLTNATIATSDDAYEINPSEAVLAEGEMYITNLAEKEIEALGLSESDKSKLLPAGVMLVNPSYMAKELGVCLGNKMDLSDIASIRAILQGYKSAFHRMRFKFPNDKNAVRKELISQIKDRTMAECFQSAAADGMNQSQVRPSAHSWVTTGQKINRGEVVRTIHLDRSIFYYYLLDQEIPANIWGAGDPSVSQNIIMRIAERGKEGIIAEGSHKENAALPFVSGCRTDASRNLYIPSEIASLNEEGSKLHLAGWWSGDLLRPVSPLDGCNSISLGDSMLMEMIYKSWKSDGLVGYWLSATERLVLHGISELLSAGVKVIGYGSGKIAIATSSNKESVSQQDEYLLGYRDDCFVRIPIDHSWDAGEFCRKLPLLSDMQKIASTWIEGLALIDEAIDSQDSGKLDAIKQIALDKLDRRIT